MIKKTLLAILLLVVFSACESKKAPEHPITFDDAVTKVAKTLAHHMSITVDKTIVFTSLVDLNNLKESSNFGRVFSESLMTQLSQRGFDVMEYRGNEIVTKTRKGEFKLNRAKVQTIADEDILILVGTYSQLENETIVNVRIINKETNILESAAGISIPLNKTLESHIISNNNDYVAQIIPSECARDEYCWKDSND